MAQILAGDFRKGITFQLDSAVMVIVDFQHVKPGKGAAFVRAKIRNVITGGIIERTFNPSEKYDLAHIDRKTMQYLYSDGEMFNFMDTTTYEQVALGKEVCEEALKYIKEEMTVTVSFYKGAAFSVEAPNFVELKITFCEPGVRGNSSGGNVTKPATLETGVIVHVPLFVNEGETIKVDTRTGEYMSRV